VTIVAVRSVRKAFSEVLAVNDVSLDVQQGEFVSILGPSGCGKTTLLRMIAGLERPDSGGVFIQEHDVTFLPPNRRPTNLVFQHGALFPHKSVYENIAYPLERQRKSRTEINARVDSMLALVRLEGFARRRPSQLSGGQARRVALARALAARPMVLLLDEPLSGLDLQLRKEMQLELRTIHQEVGTTFMYVTHDQEEALVMSDRVVVMHEGQIVQDGSPSTIYTEPANVFVAAFIGETNLLAGELVALDHGFVEVELAGSQRIRARAADNARSGRVMVSIRPELIRLESSPEASNTANQVSGHIEETVYLGNVVRVRVRADGGIHLWAELPASTGSRFARSGAAVTAAWQPGDGRVLPS
jgi:spermidine/putrescine ABC transporter ATP-binding subunit